MGVPTDVTKFRQAAYHVRRNFVSVFFPTLVAVLIYGDWSRTQHYKSKRALAAQATDWKKTQQFWSQALGAVRALFRSDISKSHLQSYTEPSTSLLCEVWLMQKAWESK